MCGTRYTSPGRVISLIVEKDTNHLNGVSTYDLVLITRHILGLEVFNAPWKWIAADVNRSGSITTFDVLELRKFILGIYNKFPSNTSWRFFDANCNFPDNPFTGYCPSEQTFVTMPVYNYPSPILFRGLKVGDVNGSADPESIAATDPDWRMDPVQLVLPDIVLKAGSQSDIPVNVDQPGYWLGFQFELMYDPQQVDIAYVAPGFLPDFDEEALAFPEPGLLATSWFSGLPQLVLPGKGLFTLRIQALRDVPLRDVLHLSPRRIRPEVYGLHEPARPVELRFASETEQSGETMIFTPRPNPTSAGVAIPLHMSQTEVVRFELADISGKVFFKTEKILEQGGRLIEVPAVAFLYAGVYMWRLHAGGKRLTGKIIRL
ncbi:MAG: T9SS type A sorting domain-containing protein [Lewinellaceae bacterium]|nr:T9SS type A sorting domain-containing protein [Lewinellaceae bacterium]